MATQIVDRHDLVAAVLRRLDQPEMRIELGIAREQRELHDPVPRWRVRWIDRVHEQILPALNHSP